MIRTTNPVLNEKVFMPGATVVGEETMTVQGAVNKTFVLALLALGSAFWVWSKFFTASSLAEGAAAVQPYIMGGVIGGLIAALVTVFKKEWAAFSAPAYALLEGLFLGGVSALFEAQFPGIVIQAVGLTFGTLLVLLGAYTSGLIKVTDKFRLGVVAATGGIALVYFVSFVLGLFGVQVGFIHQGGPIGIGFSLVVVGIAALNLVLDFDFIEEGARRSLPKGMEWYAAFGLMVTLIWLYIELLRLLSKLRSRD